MKMFIFLFSIALLFMQCSNNQITSIAQKEPVVVDGFAYDWENYSVEYIKDWHLVYGAVHSENYLFLQLSFNDPQLAWMMARRGATLWFGGDKKFGLRYIDLFSKDGLKPDHPGEMYVPKGKFSVVAEDTVLAPDISDYRPVMAKLKLDKGLYCFEFAIPLNPEENLSFLNHIFYEKYYFGFELAGISEEERAKMKDERQKNNARNPGAISGGMRGGRGGRMAGGHSAGRMQARPLDSEGKDIWFEVIMDE